MNSKNSSILVLVLVLATLGGLVYFNRDVLIDPVNMAIVFLLIVILFFPTLWYQKKKEAKLIEGNVEER